ncbi:MAG: hypothetical protein LBU26_06740 [Synergistaceae bacterium]|jgi:uncharacterized Zn finger protein|nr:hypothetical protein [Synergistaceae bacterium]
MTVDSKANSSRKRGRPPGIKVCPEFAAPSRWTEGLINSLGEIASQKQINAAKNYARSGRVIVLSISSGLLEAKVQGSRKTPYSVRLVSFRPGGAEVERILRKIGEKAIYKAALMLGEIPSELYGIFQSSGVTWSLSGFMKSRQLCSCSEPERVCKHILAVLYVAGLAFDRDPFMLLKLKGLDRNYLMEALCAPVGVNMQSIWIHPGEEGEKLGDALNLPEIVPSVRNAGFYGSRELLPGVLESHAASSSEPGHPMPILDFPFWRGETSFTDSIAPYYKAVKKFAEDGEA